MSSSGPNSAMASSSSAVSGAAASNLACAAASALTARRAGSGVSSVARSRNAAAAATPPRYRARSALIQPARYHRLQQRAGIGVIQARENELRKSRQLPYFDGFTQREDHGNRFRQEAACDERQCLRRGPVEPLRIIDQADERPFLGHHGEQPEHREADREAIRHRPGAQPECRAQRVALRAWQARQAVQHGRAQLMQDGERQFHLALNARRPHNAAVRRALLHVVQQDSFADARLAAQDQHPALTGPHLSEQPVKRRLLSSPATQSMPAATAGHRPPPRP